MNSYGKKMIKVPYRARALTLLKRPRPAGGATRSMHDRLNQPASVASGLYRMMRLRGGIHRARKSLESNAFVFRLGARTLASRLDPHLGSRTRLSHGAPNAFKKASRLTGLRVL